MRKPKFQTLFLFFLLLLYGIYASHYIFKTSFVLDGTRYFILNDDAMISMRYARNLAHGHGLVWNPGEKPVEGITNLLWAVYMAFFHLFPIPTAKMSLALQISGAVFMAINMVLVKKIAERFTQNPVMIFGAVILTGFYGPLNNWSLLGMEVSVLVMLVSWATLKALQAADTKQFSPLPYILLGIGTLVRFDMAVPYIVIWAFLSFFDRDHRKQHLLWGGALLAVFLGGQTIFRLAYYGVPFPNTYYLKVTGTPLYARLGKGVYALGKFILSFNWVLFLFPFTALFFRRDKENLLLVLLWSGQMAYSVYVGGDAWEHKGGANRYLSLALPQFFILLSFAVHQIINGMVTPLKEWLKGRDALLANLLLAVVLLGSMINMNAVLGTRSLYKWLALRTPEFADTSEYYVTLGLSIDQFSKPGATLALKAAGTITYIAEDVLGIDLYGKSDVVVAQTASHLPEGWGAITEFRPGHTKWDYAYSIIELQPDIIIQVSKDPADTETEILKYIEDNYVIIAVNEYGFTVKKDSPFIHWDEVTVVE